MDQFISTTTVQLLGWTLMHFMWQGLLVALLLFGALHLFRRSPSKTRYAVSCTALFLMLVLPVTTGFFLHETLSSGSYYLLFDGREDLIQGGINSAMPFWFTAITSYLTQLLPWIVIGWLSGVFFFSVRFAGGWGYAQIIGHKQRRPVDEYWSHRFKDIAERLRVSRPVRFFISVKAEVPMVIGWMRPMILLPASIVTGLTPHQIEMVVAHELAHIRRHDYAINLLLSICETLLFYHPGVWWVSRQVRIEREHCCDDLVVAVCGDTVSYARALTNLEALRHTSATPRLALAATDGSLLNRIRRLLDQPVQAVKRGDRWVMGACLIALVGILHLSFTLIGKARENEQSLHEHIVVERLSDPEISISITNPELTQYQRAIESYEAALAFDIQSNLESHELILEDLQIALETELEPSLEAYEKVLRQLELTLQTDIESDLEKQEEVMQYLEQGLEGDLELELEVLEEQLHQLEITLESEIESSLRRHGELRDVQESELRARHETAIRAYRETVGR